MYDNLIFDFNTPDLYPYFFLAITIITLWFRRHLLLQGTLLLIAISSALITNKITISALASILALAIATFITFRAHNYFLRVGCGILSFFIAALLLSHILPGFNNYKIINNIKLTPTALPYSLYLNFDKPMGGLFFLWFGAQFINTNTFSLTTFWRSLLITSLSVCVLSTLLLLAHYVKFEPKWNAIVYIWSFNNLIFTCISEEILFRGVLQQSFMQILGKLKYGQIAALILASLLFGLIHIAGGFIYVLLCIIAGFFYGLAYFWTGRIESSIMVHFLVNTIHFFFFTYPALEIK